MAERILFPEWRAQNQNTRYPFSSKATLINDEGRVLPDGVILDGALYPIGATAGLFLASADITFESVTLTLATPTQPAIATGTFDLLNPPDHIAFYDVYGRPAGLLVSEGRRLGLFQSWGIGTHTFLAAQTEFAGSCVFPTPEVGVRSIKLETGEVFVGDVWLVGGDGVVLRAANSTMSDGLGNDKQITTIRVDVVGDPLFRRRLCSPADLFTTPKFVQTIRVVSPNMTFDVSPDAAGTIRLMTANDLTPDTVLRINTTPEHIEISAVGSVTNI